MSNTGHGLQDHPGKGRFYSHFSVSQEKPWDRKLNTNFASKYHFVFLLLSFGHPCMPIHLSKIELKIKQAVEDLLWFGNTALFSQWGSVRTRVSLRNAQLCVLFECLAWAIKSERPSGNEDMDTSSWEQVLLVCVHRFTEFKAEGTVRAFGLTCKSWVTTSSFFSIQWLLSNLSTSSIIIPSLFQRQDVQNQLLSLLTSSRG